MVVKATFCRLGRRLFLKDSRSFLLIQRLKWRNCIYSHAGSACKLIKIVMSYSPQSPYQELLHKHNELPSCWRSYDGRRWEGQVYRMGKVSDWVKCFLSMAMVALNTFRTFMNRDIHLRYESFKMVVLLFSEAAHWKSASAKWRV